MTIDSDKILHDLLNSLDSLEGIRPGEIPNIALYMDQVTTFMDAQLASSRRFESDKVLTKTMINNYAKNKLLPPPVKKKYSPEHMMLQQKEIETVENPTGTRDVTNSSIRGLLARNLGYYIVASFLMGTQQAIQWEGILASVGNDYLVIYQPDQNRFVSGDIYALKFVEFHENQSACAGYRRRDAFQSW